MSLPVVGSQCSGISPTGARSRDNMVAMGNGLAGIFRALCQGRMSRREFVVRAAALGASAPLSLMLINAVGDRQAAAQTPPAQRPTAGTDDQVRGAGGELRVRQWFAPSNVVAHLTESPKSAAQISSMILEPLLSYAPDG